MVIKGDRLGRTAMDAGPAVDAFLVGHGLTADKFDTFHGADLDAGPATVTFRSFYFDHSWTFLSGPLRPGHAGF